MRAFSLPRISNDRIGGASRGAIGLFALLTVFNLIAWGWALLAFHGNPVLLGTAFLAYSFGLRHAFDADHIAAIDNVTRKLMQEGKRPAGVGFFFSLGHSTVVVGLAVLIAATTTALAGHYLAFGAIGGLIGTSVSAVFLFAIAIANAVVLVQVWRTFRTVRHGGSVADESLELMLAKRGFFARMFRRLFRLIEHSWQMYPLGLLFGLGFDTATEVGLLGISATQASAGMPVWDILIFPALFTAGMSLMDTADSTLMVGAYGWAFVKPIRKLWYNLTITAVSVVAAVAIGGIEALGLIAEKLDLQGPFWDTVGALGDNFGTLGYAIVALFIVSWVASFLIYRAKGYDKLEVPS